MQHSGGIRLSVVVSGRNDDYASGFCTRLSNTLDCWASVAARCGRQDEIEIVLVDWNSSHDRSLADGVLQVSDPAVALTRVVVVPQRVVASCQAAPDDVFNVSLALNVGIRRAQGTYVVFIPADALISDASFFMLMALIDGRVPLPDRARIESTALFCGFSYDVPEVFWRRADFVPRVLRTFAHRSADRNSKWLCAAAGGNYGGYVMHRDVLCRCRGWDERLCYWGWNDNDMFLRMVREHPWLSGDSFGITLGHQQHAAVGERRRANAPVVCRSFAVNDDGWGLSGAPLEERRIVTGSPPPEAGPPGVSLPQLFLLEDTDPELDRGTLLRVLGWLVETFHVTRYLEVGYRLESCWLNEAMAEWCTDVEMHLLVERNVMLADDPECRELLAIVHGEYAKKARGYLGRSTVYLVDPREASAVLGRLDIGPTHGFELITIDLDSWADDGLLRDGTIAALLDSNGSLLLRATDPVAVGRALGLIAGGSMADCDLVRISPRTVLLSRNRWISRLVVNTYEDLTGLTAVVERRQVHIFGAGTGGLQLQAALAEVGILVDGFVDNDPRKWGARTGGVEVVGLDRYDPRGKLLLVASHWHRQMAEQLQAQGFHGGQYCIVWKQRFT